jgi:large subunit ribosomal protein L6
MIKMVKKLDIKDEITYPDNVTVKFDKNTLTVESGENSLTRILSHPKIQLLVKDKIITIYCKNPRKKEKALVGTYSAHIKNMIKGVTEGFEYRMKTVYSHFPIKTTVEGNVFEIHNFLGERSPRKAQILKGVTIDVKGDDITVRGVDKEKVGQTVANIERAAAVKNRDIRVFQDGVYRISKGRL